MLKTLFLDPQKTTFIVGAVNPLGNGKHTLSDLNGKVYSLQPFWDWPAPDQPLFQDREAGAGGAFEQCDVDGQAATFSFWWKRSPLAEPELTGPVTVAFFQATQPAS